MGDLRRLIVFDLDGTLVDSRRDLADAANALIVERGGAPLPESDIGRMVGEGAARLVRRALEAAGLAIDDTSLRRFLELYDERLLRTTRPYPGIPAAVEAIAATGPIAVLTNKPLAPAVKLLEALGLQRFVQTTIGGDGPLPRKPDPASMRHLMTLHAAPPERTMLIGDSRVDFETASASGVKVGLARWGFGYETFPVAALRGDEALIDEPADLPHVVERLITTPQPAASTPRARRS